LYNKSANLISDLDQGSTWGEIASDLFNYQIIHGFGWSFSFVSIVFSSLLLSASFICALSGAVKIAAIIAGLWNFIVVVISPRTGIVLILALQIWDTALNPEEESGYNWLSPVRVLTALCIVAFIINNLWHSEERIKGVREPLFLFLSFAIVGLIPGIAAEDRFRSLMATSKLLILLGFVWVGIRVLSKPKTIIQAMCIAVIGAGTGSLFILVSGIATRAEAEHRLALAGLGVNTLGVSLGLFIIVAIGLLVFRRSILFVAISSASSLIMMATLLRTGTRSPLVAIPLSLILGSLLVYRKQVHKTLILTIFVSLLIGGVFVWSLKSGFVRGDLRDRILSIFESKTFSENVRLSLWKESLNIYSKNPFGVGPGNEIYAFYKFSTSGRSALESHNTFFSVLIEYNIFGLLIFVIAMMWVAIKIFTIKIKPLKLIAIMIFIYLMFNSMKGSIVGNRLMWQPTMLILIFTEIDMRLHEQACQKQIDNDEVVYSEDIEITAYQGNM